MVGRTDPADVAVALVAALSPVARRTPPPIPPSTLPKRTPVPAPSPTDDLSALAAAAHTRSLEAAAERSRQTPAPPARSTSRRRAPLIGLVLSSAILFGFSGAVLLAFVELPDDTARAILLFGVALAAPIAALVTAAVTRRLGGSRAHIAIASVLAMLLGLSMAWAIRLAVPMLADSIPANITALPAAAAAAAQTGLARATSLASGTMLAAWIGEAALCMAAAAAVARSRPR